MEPASPSDPYSNTEFVQLNFSSNTQAEDFRDFLTVNDPVPEPASLALFGGGLLAALFMRRRARRQRS